MIPALTPIGAVSGRWWRVTLAVSGVGWPMLLVATGAMSVGLALAGAAGLAALNTGAGALIHQRILRGGRTLWHANGRTKSHLMLPRSRACAGPPVWGWHG